MSKKKDSLKPWLSRPAINRSVTLPLTRPLTQRLSNLNEFHPNELDPYLLFDAQDSMIGTLENPTLDLDPSKPDTLNVITATRAGTATFTDVNGLIASAPANTVRVDHVDGVPMILVEPSATNLLPNSSSFENVNGSVQTTGFEAPDGSNDAVKISNINGATDPMVAWSSLATLSPSTQYSGSIFVKGSAGESVRFYLRRAFGGAMANSPFLNVLLTGSWQRVEIGSMTTASDNNNGRVFIFQSSSGTPADEVYLWGSQLEQGAVSTSVIPTSGSTVTRAADDLVISGSAFSSFFNAVEGTTYVETIPKSNQNTPHYFEYFNSSNAASNRMGVYTPVNGFSYFIAGVTNQNMGAVNLNQVNRLAVSYKVNDLLGSLNGASELAVTSAALPTGIDTLRIGNAALISGSYNASINGHIKRFIVWPYHSDSL